MRNSPNIFIKHENSCDDVVHPIKLLELEALRYFKRLAGTIEFKCRKNTTCQASLHFLNLNLWNGKW